VTEKEVVMDDSEGKRLLDVLLKTSVALLGVIFLQVATAEAVVDLNIPRPYEVYFYVGYGLPMLLALCLGWYRYGFQPATFLTIAVCIENIAQSLWYYPKYERIAYLAVLTSFVIMWLTISYGERNRRTSFKSR
jgi:hypothetical protein